MSLADVSENERRFLLQLYQSVGGDASRQVSMHDIGSELGFDKQETSRLTEALIGWQLVEIRTLSGGIGIAAEAVAQIQSLGLTDPEGAKVRLGDQPVLDSDARRAVEEVVDTLKQQAGSLGLGFDALTELAADLKTIVSQLESPKPKTAIAKACFRSLHATLKDAGAVQSAACIAELLGE